MLMKNKNQVNKILSNSKLTTPKKITELPCKSFIKSLHRENERTRRDLGIDFMMNRAI